MTSPKQRPVPFSPEMVRAILDGRKTQTRRVITKLLRFGNVTEFGQSDTPGYDWHFRDKRMCWNDLRHDELLSYLPHQPGDLLYVREAWRVHEKSDHKSPKELHPLTIRQYEADQIIKYHPDTDMLNVIGFRPGRFRQGRHMPKWMARIWLEVTEVRVQRLQDISEADASAEGAIWEDYETQMGEGYGTASCCFHGQDLSHRDLETKFDTARESFRDLWDSLNGKRPGCSWSDNPYVTATTFKRIDPPKREGERQ